MMEFLTYILQVNIGFSLMFLIYYFVFMRFSHFRLNRCLLLTIVLISCLIPFVESELTNSVVGFITLPEVVLNAPHTISEKVNDLGVTNSAFYLYIIFSAVILGKLLFEIGTFLKYVKSRNRKRVGKVIELESDPQKPTFSFFKYFHINPNDDSEAIRKHELTHIRELHSADIIFLKLFMVLNWFNPFIYLAIKAQRLNHEYLADHEAINSSLLPIEYCKLLLKKTKEPNKIKLAHAFSLNTNVKTRIMMITKKQSSAKTKWYYLLMLPIVVVTMSFVSNTQGKNIDSYFSEPDITVKDTVYQKVDVMPVFGSGMQDLVKYLIENIKYPKMAEKDNITGKVFVSFIVADDGKVINVELVKGVRDDIDNEAIRVISNMPKWNPGSKEGEQVKVKMVLPIMFAL